MSINTVVAIIVLKYNLGRIVRHPSTLLCVYSHLVSHFITSLKQKPHFGATFKHEKLLPSVACLSCAYFITTVVLFLLFFESVPFVSLSFPKRWLLQAQMYLHIPASLARWLRTQRMCQWGFRHTFHSPLLPGCPCWACPRQPLTPISLLGNAPLPHWPVLASEMSHSSPDELKYLHVH